MKHSPDSYDYQLRVIVEDELIEAESNSNGDYFGWYEGETVILAIDHKEHVLNIKLDEKGNMSLKRSVKMTPAELHRKRN